jgi:hypothetical protein
MYLPFTRLRSRGRVENTRLQFTVAWLVRVAFLAISGVLLAQPADNAVNRSQAARTKPQVIYHLPSSKNAAALHSQAKGQNLAVDEGPASPQISRENPNASAPQVRPEASAPPPQQHQIKTSKPSSNRSVRPQSVKAKGQGSSRPNKARKK